MKCIINLYNKYICTRYHTVTSAAHDKVELVTFRFIHCDGVFFYFDIVQLLWNNLYC